MLQMIREFINFTIGITFLEKNLKTPFIAQVTDCFIHSTRYYVNLSRSLPFYLTVVLFWVIGLKMSFKSYADAVSGSNREEKSVAKLCNTFWRKYQVEDEEDAFAKAIESSKVSTRCHVNFGY